MLSTARISRHGAAAAARRNFTVDRRGAFGLAQIRTSETGVVTFLGRYNRTIYPGLNIYFPFIEKVGVVSNRTSELSFEFKSMTKESALITLDIAVQYCVKPEDADKAVFELDDPETQIQSFVENVVRAMLPRYSLKEIFSERQSINHEIEEALAKRMKQYGFTIASTQILNIDADKKVQDAMNAVVSASHNKEAAEFEAAAERIKLIAHAEADAERRFLQGQGTARQRAEILKGYESGISEMAERLDITPREVSQFLLKIQELDTKERIGTSNNAKVIFLSGDESEFARATQLPQSH